MIFKFIDLSPADLRAAADAMVHIAQAAIDKLGDALTEQTVRDLRARIANVRSVRAVDRMLLAMSVGVLEAGVFAAATSVGPRELTIAIDAPHTHELDALLAHLVGVAARGLQQHGDVVPLAAVIDHELGLASFAFEAQDDDLDAVAVMMRLANGLREGAARGDYTAAGTCANVEALEGARRTDALAFTLDHIDGTSFDIYVPYLILSGVVFLGTARVTEGAHDVFPRVS